MGAVQGRKLLRKDAEVRRLQALRTDATFDLDATAARQVLDGAVVDHVPVDAGRAPALDGLDDPRRVFVARRLRDLGLAAEHRVDGLGVFAPPSRPAVGVEAARAEVAGP